jgi:DNA/RNA endonuclease G (NUC1)
LLAASLVCGQQDAPLKLEPLVMQRSGIAYERLDAETIIGPGERRDNWPRARAEVAADGGDYTGSGFVRFHLAPAADFGRQADIDATFDYRNCAPGDAKLNGGLWSQLEQYVRGRVGPNVVAYVVTAPVWLPGPDGCVRYKTIGKGVAVPTHFVKAVLFLRNGQPEMKAWLVPNCAPPAGAKFSDDTYKTKVDDIEQALGVDLFPWLDDTVERRLESARA